MRVDLAVKIPLMKPQSRFSMQHPSDERNRGKRCKKRQEGGDCFGYCETLTIG